MFLIVPEDEADKAAMALGNHVVENPTEVDVGIWRDENIFLFLVKSKKEATALFETEVIKDHPKVVGVEVVSDRMSRVYVRTSEKGVLDQSFWSEKDSFQSLHKDLKASEDTLKGLQLRVSYLPWPPHVFEVEENKEVVGHWGYEISMMEAISAKKGFSVVYHKPLDNEWGNIKTRNNSSIWSGMIGEVAYNRADISLSAITIQQPRSMVATPTGSYGPEYIQAFAPGPLPLPPFYSLFRPFDLTSWLFICSLCLVFPVFAYFLLLPVSRFDLKTTVLYSIASFLRESFYSEFYDLNGFRVQGTALAGVYLLMGTWLMGTNIMTMAYTCNLQAHMITPGYSKPLLDLSQVIESRIPIKMYGIGAGIENEWASSQDPDIRSFYQERIILPFSPKFEEFDQVGNGTAIFVDWYTSIVHTELRFPSIGNKKLIHLVDTGSKMSPKYALAWQMRKRFRGKRLISLHMSWMVESGLVGKMYKDAVVRMHTDLSKEEKEQIVKRKKGRGLQAWSLEELSPAFLAQIMLVAACIPVLGWEIFQGYRDKKKIEDDEKFY